MLSDESLILQFKAGSRDCFEELFARYRNAVYGFFRRRLPDRQRAEDLAQETWMAVLQGTERYQPRALFRTYLYAIALRVLAGERRRAAKQASHSLLPEQVAVCDPPDTAGWIREAINNLDSVDREILLLREYEQLTYEEIATVLHIPLNTVRSRLFRARLALKQMLEPDSTKAMANER